MARNFPNPRRRAGFTLIELVVVVAIIAVLIGMLLVGIFKFFVKGDEARTRKELSLLTAAVGSFNEAYKVDYFPSRLILKEDGKYWENINVGDEKLARDSALYLKKMFPGLRVQADVPIAGAPVPPGNDWNGNGQIDAGYVILDGSQCLVFFLGGVKGTLGFANTTGNPAPTNLADVKRAELLYQFETGRLTQEDFPRYNDTWGTPYAYFSNYGTVDGYSKYGTSDDNRLSPYCVAVSANDVVTYHNGKSHQIISGGPDRKLGPGGLWGKKVDVPFEGRDDMSNFHGGKMGLP